MTTTIKISDGNHLILRSCKTAYNLRTFDDVITYLGYFLGTHDAFIRYIHDKDLIGEFLAWWKTAMNEPDLELLDRILSDLADRKNLTILADVLEESEKT